MTLLKANWQAPEIISAGSTYRYPGFSLGPYAENNFGEHVGDRAEDVQKNRQKLRSDLNLKSEPFWLNQTHSHRCIIADNNHDRDADAAVSRDPKQVLVVMTADCLPITLCNRQGTEIGVIHAGWRGLAAGIIENTLEKLHSKHEELLAWIGPAICKNCFETGDDVYRAFQQNYDFTSIAFQPHKKKWHADLPLLAELILKKNGIEAISQSALCTFELKNAFYSYRRTPQSGRMATLIWFNH
jgi:YfiH family protein